MNWKIVPEEEVENLCNRMVLYGFLNVSWHQMPMGTSNSVRWMTGRGYILWSKGQLMIIAIRQQSQSLATSAYHDVSKHMTSYNNEALLWYKPLAATWLPISLPYLVCLVTNSFCLWISVEICIAVSAKGSSVSQSMDPGIVDPTKTKTNILGQQKIRIITHCIRNILLLYVHSGFNSSAEQ
jgi:hypothetical protein